MSNIIEHIITFPGPKEENEIPPAEYAADPGATPEMVKRMISAQKDPSVSALVIENYLKNPNADTNLLKQLVPNPSQKHAWRYAENTNYDMDFLSYIRKAGMLPTFILSYTAVPHFERSMFYEFLGLIEEDELMSCLEKQMQIATFACQFAQSPNPHINWLTRLLENVWVQRNLYMFTYSYENNSTADPGFLDKLKNIALFQ